MAWRAKLSPQDLDDVLKRLQTTDTKMNSFTQFSNTEVKTEPKIQEAAESETQKLINVNNQAPVATEKSLSEVANTEPCSNNENQNVADLSNNASDMDSTFIADSSANNLNTSTT
jgi:hypothetical protein